MPVPFPSAGPERLEVRLHEPPPLLPGDSPGRNETSPSPALPSRLKPTPAQQGHLPTLVYLPGLHGDWTLVSSFRAAIRARARFVDMTYPRTTTWSLADYAAAIHAALAAKGVHRGWLIAESFGSQIAWAMLASQGTGFEIQGIIFAGGFTRHPFNLGVRLAHFMSTRWPRWFLRAALSLFGKYASIRHRRAPETIDSIAEFISWRLDPADRLAISHRLKLIAENDPRPLAAQTRLPVFSLVGFWDPIVPALPVWLWLRRACPGYRGTRLVWRADHNVLGTAPAVCAGQILQWLTVGKSAPTEND